MRVTFRIAKDGDNVAAGETGELQIRTPFGMLGYLDNPALTEASFEDGYFKTGDLARPAGDGAVALVGRAKDVISRGGNKIAPLEIDNLLAEHPEIAAALCAGVPDERLGEVIHAVIVTRAGARLDAAALRDWLLGAYRALQGAGRFSLPRCAALWGERQSGPQGRGATRGAAERTALTTRPKPRR